MKRESFKHTNEQLAAIAIFSDERSLILNACAGSGKTATLEAMAHAAGTRKGLYIVFSRAAADEAKARFPSHINVLTSHSLALRQIRNQGYSDEKLFNALNSKAIVKVLNLQVAKFDDFVLLDFEIGHAIRRTIERFCHSDNQTLTSQHVPENALLNRLSVAGRKRYQTVIAMHATELWSLMRDRNESGIPLGHDGYFKLWSLTKPQLPYDFVLLDEAQDSNPALIDVLRHQENCQLIAVGDRYQQIYEWRGAVNAMEQIKAEQCSLTQSFRYGQHIADFATKLLDLLGNEKPLSGRNIAGGFTSESPDAYLSRTNSVLVRTLVELESQIAEIYIVGEGRDVISLLDDVKRLKSGQKAAFGEFFGFSDWDDVLLYCGRVGSNPLSTIVQLVEGYGERHLRQLVTATCKDASVAQITLSTAHKAKGLEFDDVALGDDFAVPLELPEFTHAHGETALDESVVISHTGKDYYILKSELQLLYVAVTRAKRNVILPIWCYEFFPDSVGKPNLAIKTKRNVSAARTTNGNSAKRHQSIEKYAVLDFETTGLNPGRGDRAIEIGVTLLANGQEIDSYSSLINPGKTIDPYITSLTGISNKMVASAPSARVVMNKVLDFVSDAHLVAHNASFDKKFWQHEIQYELGHLDDRDFLCTLMLSRRIFQSFVSHKLDEIARELRIKNVRSHRALADSQATAQVLAVMFHRLQCAYPDQTINAQFLKTYQKRSKASLPDLTTQRHAQTANKTVAPAKTKAKKKRSSTKTVQSENAERAEILNANAQRDLTELEQLLAHTLDIDDRLNWQSLVDIPPFKSTTPRKPYIIYNKEGIPTDVKYLEIPDSKPAKPAVTGQPKKYDFSPKIRVIDKILFRSDALREQAKLAYERAFQQWKTDYQKKATQYSRALARWHAMADSIDLQNKQRYEQCLEEQEQWRADKQAYDEKVQLAVETVEKFRAEYEIATPSAVVKYFTEILSRSIYPDYFPDDFVVRYEESNKSLVVRKKLLRPDDLPSVASVSYVKSRDEIKTKELTTTAKNKMYASVVRAISVRTIHEIFESDTADTVQHVVFNGFVDTVNLSTGHDQGCVVVSLYSSKQNFLSLRLDRVDATSCFDGLGGRGTTSSISKLKAVDPFILDNISMSG